MQKNQPQNNWKRALVEQKKKKKIKDAWMGWTGELGKVLMVMRLTC